MTVQPPPSTDDELRGRDLEAMLWTVIARLRGRGWRISLWEIQRAQDVVAYLVARLQRAPTDDELLRYLRPVLCAHERELAEFDEVFQESVTSAAPALASDAATLRRRPAWRSLLLGAAAVAFCVAFLELIPPAAVPDQGPSSAPPSGSDLGPGVPWETVFWVGLAVTSAVAVLIAGWSALDKRLRRSATRDSGHDLELRWAIEHPLDTTECARTARALRTWSLETGQALDLPRTVEASIRAGMRLTPRFVQYKRSPEYLAVVEQRSAQDVLAAHHAAALGQIGAQGVPLRQVGLLARSQVVLDPARGRHHPNSLQPASDRERLLLFAQDRTLRHPLTGAPRPWLGRLDRWFQTTQIAPDATVDEPLPAIDRVVADIRALDPGWAPPDNAEQSTRGPLPAIFGADEERWIEACAPPGTESERALDLLATALGPAGWYWLSACALYPEINYGLTVSLGSLLRADDGKPLSAHVDIGLLARLPWFRHAYMPDWLRTTLIGTLGHVGLVQARGALDQILISGLAGAGAGSRGLPVGERRSAVPPAGHPERASSAGDDNARDRVFVDGMAIRRRKLAARAPRHLLSAVRRRREQFPPSTSPAEAPSLRVRRALAWCNGILLFAPVASLTLLVGAQDGTTTASVAWITIVISRIGLGAIAAVFSGLAGRPRGVVVGGLALALTVLLLSYFDNVPAFGSPDSAPVVALGETIVLLVSFVTLRTRPRVSAVPWSTFQKRNRTAFIIGTVTLFSLIPTTLINSVPQPVVAILVVGIFGSLATVLASAYFGGVRLLPALAGLAILIGLVTFIGNRQVAPSILFGGAAVVVVLLCYGQLLRVRQRPPIEFWETRWADGKWPLVVVTIGAIAGIAWYFSANFTAVLWCTAVPVAAVMINVAVDRLSTRLGGTLARFGDEYRLRLHLQ